MRSCAQSKQLRAYFFCLIPLLFGDGAAILQDSNHITDPLLNQSPYPRAASFKQLFCPAPGLSKTRPVWRVIEKIRSPSCSPRTLGINCRASSAEHPSSLAAREAWPGNTKRIWWATVDHSGKKHRARVLWDWKGGHREVGWDLWRENVVQVRSNERLEESWGILKIQENIWERRRTFRRNALRERERDGKWE